jgi:hypothetical protein
LPICKPIYPSHSYGTPNLSASQSAAIILLAGEGIEPGFLSR